MGLTLGIASSMTKSENDPTGCAPLPTAEYVTVEETGAAKMEKTEATKRVQSPHRSPNQNRRKTQKSLLHMMDYELMEEEVAELCTFDFIESPTEETVPTLNTPRPPNKGTHSSTCRLKTSIYRKWGNPGEQ